MRPSTLQHLGIEGFQSGCRRTQRETETPTVSLNDCFLSGRVETMRRHHKNVACRISKRKKKLTKSPSCVVNMRRAVRVRGFVGTAIRRHQKEHDLTGFILEPGGQLKASANGRNRESATLTRILAGTPIL